jgi:16S rRNA (cytosine967-C5)-methyltransferase
VIQDEASQLVPFLLGTAGNSGTNDAKGCAKILDCCAAPGGKTSILAERNPEALIIAIDVHPRRASLTRKLVRNQNVKVVAADANKLPVAGEFDRILVDAPCSGTGTLARNPEIKWRLEAADILEMQGRQRAILQSALGKLAVGGKLLYSTCSLEKEENADVVDSVLAENKSFRLLDCKTELRALQQNGQLTWKDLDSLVHGSYLRTLPGVHHGDGFFAALIERVSD